MKYEEETELVAKDIGPLTPKGAQVHFESGHLAGYLIRFEPARDGKPAVAELSRHWPKPAHRLKAAGMHWITTQAIRPDVER